MTTTEYRYRELLNNISRMLLPDNVSVTFEIHKCNRVEMQKLAHELDLSITIGEFTNVESLWIGHSNMINIILWT